MIIALTWPPKEESAARRALRGPENRSAHRRWVVALRMALAAVLTSLATVMHAGDLAPGDAAPRISIALVDGRTLAPRNLEGRVVLQYFWATWCPICRSDLPRLQALYGAYRPQGLEIVAQSLDDDPATVASFWREQGYTFPVAMRSEETRAGFGAIKGTPTLFLTDRGGTVRLKRLGRLPDGMLEAHIAALIAAPEKARLK